MVKEIEVPTRIYDLALAPDGSQFAVLLNDGRCQVHRASDLEFLFELEWQSAALKRLAYSPDGFTLVGCGDGMHFWDLRARALRISSGGCDIWVGFTPDGRTLVTDVDSGEMKLWNVATGQEMLSVPLGARLFEGEFNRDATILALGTFRIEKSKEDCNVRLMRIPTLDEIDAVEAKER